jgi:diacylglycerol kinase (ATP)
VGVDSEVAYGIPKFRRLPLCGGSMAYQLSIALRVLRPLAKHLRITVDDETLEGDYVIATVCNGKSYGGGYFAAPEASVTDGLLDVVLVKKLSRLRLAKVLGIYKRGEHMHAGSVREDLRDIMQFFRAREVCIQPPAGMRPIVNIDGECAPAGGLHAKVLPLAASFVLPVPLASGGKRG